MKRNFILLLNLCIFIISCNNEKIFEQDIIQSNSLVQSTTWQKQVEYAQNKNGINTKTNDVNGIRLQRYIYKGIINSESERMEIMEKLFSDTSYTVRYIDISNFEIIPLNTLRQEAKEQGISDPFAKLRAQLGTLIKVGMELIDLEWSYKGITFYSTAIASTDNEGIIYDHIGYLILETDNSKSEIERVSLNVPLIKMTNEPGGSPIIQRFTKQASIPNLFGTIVMSYKIICSSYFDERGILNDRNLDAVHSASPGFSCSADIRTVSGEIGSSNFHEFAWGYTYGSGITVSLGWNGNGFSISGGGQGATGTEIHRP